MQTWFTDLATALALGSTLVIPATGLAYGNGTPDEQPPAEEPKR